MSTKLDYDQVAAEYAQHRRVHPEVLRDLLSTSRIGSGSRVLEVGCGTANYLVALEKATGCTAWGIDPSVQMLALAQGRSPRIQVQPGAAEHLEFSAGYFDLVFSVDLIHHVRDRLAYFREAHRVLRPGGKLCTVTDSEEIIRHRQPLSAYFPETVPVELDRYPPIIELRAQMTQASFGDIAEAVVEFPYLLASAQAYRDKAFSSLHLISEDALQRGLERLEGDLRNGPIPCVSRYLLLWGTKAQPIFPVDAHDGCSPPTPTSGAKGGADGYPD